MVAHTAFLISARRLAPGVIAPPRRRKPSKGAEAYALRRAAQAALAAADEGDLAFQPPHPPPTSGLKDRSL
jgi:tRNA (adenine57-N1/adenine58-N1)-methyltransferase